MHRIGEEVSEALDRAPAQIRVLRTVRPKYACRACEGPIVQAPAPARLVEGGLATTAFIAYIAVAKYAWLSTLYRQTQILAGYGVNIDRQTLARWMKALAGMLKGLYELQLATMHGFGRLFVDETPMPVLDPGRGRTRICQFWAHATDDRSWQGPAPPAVVYVFARSRGKKEIMSQLAGFEGVCHVDGYAAYDSMADDEKMSGKILLVYCLIHARRNFVKVHKTTKSPFAQEVIERIGAVYAIEARIRGRKADERRAVRQAETKPLMEALKARLEAVRDGISRQSTLIKAIDYMLERWKGLTAFLDDGRLEPDTNTVERTIRPIGIGKKNSLFSGDEGGGETWAILSSLLNTANSMASIPRPIWPTFSNGWSPARRKTTSFMNSWSGTGRPRARPKPARRKRPPQHEQAEVSPVQTPGAKAGQDDHGRLRHVLRATRTMDERAGEIVARGAPPAGDVAFHGRWRGQRGRRRAGVDDAGGMGVPAPRRRSRRLQSRHRNVLRHRGHAHAPQRDQRNAVDAAGDLRASVRANGERRD